MNSKRRTPHFHKSRYYNYPDESIGGISLESAKLYAHSFLRRLWDKSQHHHSWFQPMVVPSASSVPALSWIGHATFLIQMGGINILTDPIFGSSSLLFPRILPPGHTIPTLPRIHYVIISHNHRDHMDEASLCALRDAYNPVFLVPHGDKKWFDKRSFEHVHEFTWWQDWRHKGPEGDVELIFLPSFHWSQRGMFDRNTSLWGSWMVRHKESSIYFAGDTGYYDHFKEIGHEFGNISCALMPIGPCEPRQHMNRSHLGAEQACQAFLELGARSFVPMHWGTFHFGVDLFLEPVERLRGWWRHNSSDLLDKKLLELKMGQHIVLE